jgi:hypothetical protein
MAHAQSYISDLNNSRVRCKPERREPSLRGPNCNAVLHPLLVAYEDSSLVKLV